MNKKPRVCKRWGKWRIYAPSGIMLDMKFDTCSAAVAEAICRVMRANAALSVKRVMRGVR